MELKPLSLGAAQQYNIAFSTLSQTLEHVSSAFKVKKRLSIVLSCPNSDFDLVTWVHGIVGTVSHTKQ